MIILNEGEYELTKKKESNIIYVKCKKDNHCIVLFVLVNLDVKIPGKGFL